MGLGQPVVRGRGPWSSNVTGIDNIGRLDEQCVHLSVSERAVLDASGNHEKLSGIELDVAVSQLDRQPTVDNQEQLISVVVGMPDELALELDDLDLVVVKPRHRLRRPVLRKPREHPAKINRRMDGGRQRLAHDELLTLLTFLSIKYYSET
jgi:hypothetical protein